MGSPRSGGGAPGPACPSRHLLTNCSLSDRDIRIGDTLGCIYSDPILEPYYDDVVGFINWLEKTIGIDILIRGYTHFPHGRSSWQIEDDIEPFTEFEYSKKAATRWSLDYVNIILAWLYNLQEHTEGWPVLMGSFTVPHEYNRFRQFCNPGMNHEACFPLLKSGWRSFYNLAKRRFGKFPYVKIWEAHELGYPHFHAALYGTFSDDDQDWMKKYWARRIGYPEHWEVALTFSETRMIEHPVAYMMKYISKSLYEGWKEWTPGEWVFNALLRKTATRSFQPSQDLQHIMKKSDRKNPHNVYTAILASGIPRKGGEDEDMPVLIAAPKAADDEYTSDAIRNPYLAPYIPVKALPGPAEPIDRARRIRTWVELHCDTTTIWEGSKPVMALLPEWKKRRTPL